MRISPSLRGTVRVRAPAIVATILCCLASSASAACTDQRGDAAERTAQSPQGWQQLYRLFKSYAGCDDGAVAEGYSDTVVRLLTRTSPDLLSLSTLSKSDLKFEQFVIRHIDQLMSPQQSATIANRVDARCPPSARDLCARIMVKLRAESKLGA